MNSKTAVNRFLFESIKKTLVCSEKTCYNQFRNYVAPLHKKARGLK